MKSIVTVSAVVLAHAAVLSLIGCRSTTGFPEKSTGSGYVAPSPATPTAPEMPATPTSPASPASQGLTFSSGTSGSAIPAENWGSPPAPEPAPELNLAPKPEQLTETPAGEVQKVGEGKTYVVKKNEGLSVIAKREGVSVKSLAAANGLPVNASLKQGQKLVIPAGAHRTPVTISDVFPGSTPVKSSGGAAYVVKKGDSLSVIAKAHGTTVSKIKAANNLKSDNIREGQKLVMPGAMPGAAPKSGTTAATVTGNTALPIKAGAPATGTTQAPAPARGAGGMPTDGFGGFGIGNAPASPTPATTTASPIATPATAPADSAPNSTLNH